MAYVLRPSKSVKRNIRRVGVRELDRAIAALEDPSALGAAQSVHDARKRCKKVRGLIRLARPGLGSDYDALNTSVRDAARMLGGARDATAIRRAWDDLVTAAGADRDLSGTVRSALGAGPATLPRDLDEPLGLLREARDRMEAVTITNDPSVLLGGFADNYRRGRAEFRWVLETPSDANLHAWRKRTKYCWHHARLLHPVAPSVLDPFAANLKALSDGLGDDHDLALLGAALSSHPDIDPAAARTASDLVDGLRADLRDRCVRLGARLYAESPRPLERRLGRYWTAWDDVGRERPVGEIADLASQPSDRPFGSQAAALTGS